MREGIGGDFMTRMEKSIDIKAPPEKVWEMLALDRWTEWLVGAAGAFLDLKDLKFTSEVNTPKDKYRVGASAYPPAHPKADFKVTESIENEKITYLHGGGSSMAYILKPTDGGTRLTYVLDTEFKSIQEKILMKAFGRLGERDVMRSLEKLKGILEK